MIRRPALAALILAACGAAWPSAQANTLAIVTPKADDVVSGTIAIQAELPAGAALKEAVVYADGREICRVSAPPIVCQWNAGDSLRQRHIRVVATMSDGRRLTANRFTRKLTVDDVSDVDVVLVTVSVTDANGRFVPGLNRRSFRLYEDDVEQDVTSFTAETVKPEVLTAVDVSGSMRDALPEVKRAVQVFDARLSQASGVSIAGFNHTFFVLANRDAAPAQRLRAIDRMAPWGATALYDALLQGVELLNKQPGRKALVLFTDGADSASQAALDSAERRLKSSDVLLYTVGFGDAVKSVELRQRLESLSATSGALSFFPGSTTDLERVFFIVVTDLSNQYVLGYAPRKSPTDGTWRAIRVVANDPKLRVRARQGYLAERTR
jgi:Ca-activated chloride channel family protein